MAQENANPRMGAGGQWTSAEYTHKARVLLSKAILSQAAVASVLEVMLPEGGPVDRALKAAEPNLEDISVSPWMVEAMRLKLIDAMEWSHLARDRIKEMISQSLLSADLNSRPGSVNDGASIKLNEMPLALAESNGLQFRSEVSQIAVLHVIPASRPQSGERERSHEQFFTEFLLSDEDHIIDQDGQNSTGFASLGLDSRLNNILTTADEADPSNTIPPKDSGPADTSIELPHHRSSSLPDAATDGQRLVDINNQRCEVTAEESRRSGSKRDRDELISSEEGLRVEYQELRPGSAVGKKKGIPYDGHQYWKKYGSKSIQKYKYCRGYYKCSLWNKCKATKTVTPTNNDPSVFEVVYEHKHTCSVSSVRSRRRPCCILTAPITGIVEVETPPVSEFQGPADPEASSPEAALHMPGHECIQTTEISRPLNVDHADVGTTIAANEGAVICESNLPMSTSLSECVLCGELAPCDVTASDCAKFIAELGEVDISAASERLCLSDVEAAAPDVDPHMPGEDWDQITEMSRLINGGDLGEAIATFPVIEEVGCEQVGCECVTESDFHASEDFDHDSNPNFVHQSSTDLTFLGPKNNCLWADTEMDADILLALVDAMYP